MGRLYSVSEEQRAHLARISTLGRGAAKRRTPEHYRAMQAAAVKARREQRIRDCATATALAAMGEKTGNQTVTSQVSTKV